jgi:hypothetical protein
MEVIGDKRSTQIYLDISPLFFHVVSKLVQALQKWLLDLGFDGVGAVWWMGWGPEMALGTGHLLLPPWLGKSYVLMGA